MVLTQHEDVTEDEEHPLSFPYHYGSHATNACSGGNKYHHEVSIPLWFSRNVSVHTEAGALDGFPYHYGSHATVLSLLCTSQ